jgi:hypothetical protein
VMAWSLTFWKKAAPGGRYHISLPLLQSPSAKVVAVGGSVASPP